MNKQIKVTVNGVVRSIEIDTRARLVDVIRDILHLTARILAAAPAVAEPAPSCSTASTVKSCCALAVDVDGASILTIEGLGDDGQLHPIQEAFAECHGLQCGFCTPGMILSALQLLEANPSPDDDQIRDAIAGNICRCTGYVNVVVAIREAAKRMSHAGCG